MAIQPLALQIGAQNPVGNALAQIGQTITDVQQQRRQNALLDLAEKRDARQATLQDAALKQKQDQVAFERTKAQAPVIARLLDGVSDQPSWDAALASASSLGLDTSKVPRQYDPAVVDGYKQVTAALMDPEKRYKSVGDMLVDLQGKGGPQAVMGSPKPVSVAPGGTLVNPQTGQPMFTAPDRTQPPLAIPDPNSPTGFRYVPRDQAVGQPAMGPSGLSMEFGPDGKPTRIMSGPGLGGKGADKPLTENQGKATGFALRMDEAEKRIQSVLTDNPAFSPANAKDNLATRLPAGNYAVSAPFQLYRQAQEDWVRAKLRLESGAAIGVKEMDDEIKTYFPQPGDSAAVIAQKKQARGTAMKAMEIQAGPGVDKLPKDTAPAPPGGSPSKDDLAKKYGVTLE